ncbi:ATP-binding cassette domain-containing protein [Streptomyces microflavus]
MARYWDPQDGTVELVPQAADDPVDLRDLAEEDLRAAVCVVGQEAPLFHGTLAENLRLGAPDATDRELAAVVRVCGLTSVADALPQGLDTPVGERGATLSGGQRARVALARGLLARPGSSSSTRPRPTWTPGATRNLRGRSRRTPGPVPVRH